MSAEPGQFRNQCVRYRGSLTDDWSNRLCDGSREFLGHKTGIWFGWSGKVATHTKIATQKVVHDKITYITLDLSKEDHQEYYNGFTNRVVPDQLQRLLLAAYVVVLVIISLENIPKIAYA